MQVSPLKEFDKHPNEVLIARSKDNDPDEHDLTIYYNPVHKTARFVVECDSCFFVMATYVSISRENAIKRAEESFLCELEIIGDEND